jgi:PEP-CTERM motif
MQKNRNSILLGCVLAGACLAPLAARANPIVSLELTGPAGPSLHGIYTDPYYAKIGPAGQKYDSQFKNDPTISIYCDDFYDDVHDGQVWQASVTNVDQLSTTKLDTGLMFHDGLTASMQSSDYMAAAWLVEQIAGGKLTTLETELDSYAIWRIFDPHALQGLSSTDGSGAWDDYEDAFAAVKNDTPSDFSNIVIYTPLDDTPGCASSQEYFGIIPKGSVPEPSMLSLGALGLLAIAFAVRRRRRVAA